MPGIGMEFYSANGATRYDLLTVSEDFVGIGFLSCGH